MSYENIIIYYFSGTGNALRVSKWIQDLATEKSVGCELIDIAKQRAPLLQPPAGNVLLILISPIHGFNYPPIVLDFIWKFPSGNSDVLLMNTRAGMKIGNMVTPGLTGMAFYFAGAVMKTKGYRIRGALPVDMPSNWISLHPGLNTHTVLFLHKKMKHRVRTGISRVMEGKKHLRVLREALPDLAVSPISVAYYFVGRFLFAKTYFASSSCNRCSLCVDSCPVHAIKKVDGRPYWTFRCESCMKCMSNCPKCAIETAHGSIAIISILFTSVITVFIYGFFDLYVYNLQNKWIEFILESVLFLAVLAVWYRLIHFLMRFRWIEKLVVYTSLTKYRFWGKRYKAQEYKDF